MIFHADSSVSEHTAMTISYAIGHPDEELQVRREHDRKHEDDYDRTSNIVFGCDYVRACIYFLDYDSKRGCEFAKSLGWGSVTNTCSCGTQESCAQR